MSTMIILTAEEAQKTVGISPTHGWAALVPVPIKDGTYVLPPDVMTDPTGAHADMVPFLSTLPQRDVADDEFFTNTPEKPISDIEAQMYADAKIDWKDQTTERGTVARDVQIAATVAEKAL